MQVNQKIKVMLSQGNYIMMTIDQRWDNDRIDRHILEALMSKGMGYYTFEKIPTRKQRQSH